jgi:GWxTD domain-containing protein
MRTKRHPWRLIVLIVLLMFFICFAHRGQAYSTPLQQTQKADSLMQAVRSLESEIAKDPQNHALYTRLGYLHLQLKDWNAATDAFKQSIELDDASAEAYNGLGLAHHGKGKSPFLPFEALRKLFKVDNYSIAERHYKRALEIDPNYIDPLYNMGVNYIAKGGTGNYENAVDALRHVLEHDFEYKDADYMLGLAFQHLRDFVNAELTFKRVMDANRTVGKAMMRLSEIYLETGREEEATEMYYGGVVRLNEPKEWDDLYAEIRILLEPEERERFLTLDMEEKGEFVRKFWKSKDPTPTTPNNERLIEHFRRIAFVRENFPDIIPPYYDDRGKVYVKYGPPDAKYVSQMRGEGVKDNESWSYEKSIRRGLTFDFVKKGTSYREVQDLSEAAPAGSSEGVRNTTMLRLYRDRADFTESYSRFSLETQSIDQSVMSKFRATRHNATEDAPVSVFRYEQAETFLPFVYNVSQFRTSDRNSRVEIYLGVSNNQLMYMPSQEGISTSLGYTFVLQDSNYADLDRRNNRFSLRANTQEEVRNQLFLHQENFVLSPGKHTLAIRVENPQGRSHGSYSNEIEIRNFRGNSLMMSDVQLASDIQPSNTEDKFVKNGLKVVPYPYTAVRIKRPVYLYFEIYNLKYNASGNTDYTVTHKVDMMEYKRSFLSKTFGAIGRLFGGKKQMGISTSYQQVKNDTEAIEYLSLDLGKLPVGIAQLTVSVTDNTSNETTSQTAKIQLIE